MLSNHILMALRSLRRNKLITGINLAGLTIGMATCLLILLFIRHEWSYDRFNHNADRIVRVTFGGKVQGELLNEASVMPPVAATMKADYPEVEDATRIRDYGRHKIAIGAETFRDQSLVYADANVFSIFTLPFLAGDPASALQEPNTVILTESAAKKYFGKNNPVGQILGCPDISAQFRVTGVIRDIPDNSHLQFDVAASMTSLPESRETSWMQSNFFTYLLLRPGADYRKLEARLPGMVDKYLGPQFQEAMGMTLAGFRQNGNDLIFSLQPLTDIYLHSSFANDLSKHGDVRYLWIFGAIAVFMLLIACINFMNLHTAGAGARAREVGIRKAVGSGRATLIGQFLTESMLLTLSSTILAVALAEMLLPAVTRLSGIPLHFQWAETPWLLPALLGFALLTGLLAGSYPAFYLSSFRPLAMLRGVRDFASPGAGRNSRGGLVVFQFMLSVGLIICTTVVYRQLDYIRNTDLGYDRDELVVLPYLGVLGSNREAFLDGLRNDSRIQDLTVSGYLPAGPSDNNNFFVYPGNREEVMVKTLRYDVDAHYLSTFGIRLAAGRNFSPEYGSDSSAIIVNRAAAVAFGWGDQPLGQTVTTNLQRRGEQRSYQVIGMVDDFHFRSMHERISPLVMVLSRTDGPAILKVKTADMPALLTDLRQRWSAHTGEPFDYTFMDDRVRDMYRTEAAFGDLLGIFTALTILVACMGLFGLAVFTAEQRTREIGIRKVLGASVTGITRLLTFDFLKLVVIAVVLASPLAWYAMQRWLAGFAYRIDIHAWVFLLAGALALLIAFATVGFHSVRAAMLNPVDSLRND